MGNISCSHNNDNEYIKPEMINEVPILKKYCSNTCINNKNSKHNCKKLRRLMFRARNFDKYKNDHTFRKKFKGICNSGEYDTDTHHDIEYHIKELMNNNEDESTIINTCRQFENVCDRLRKDSDIMHL